MSVQVALVKPVSLKLYAVKPVQNETPIYYNNGLQGKNRIVVELILFFPFEG
jgi:hypothetical protein